ncbi:MAG: hypothetical protein ACK4MQ_01875 [Hyphomonas sp.]
MGWARLPVDVRGPFGLLGVGLLAGAAGLGVLSIQDDGGPAANPGYTEYAGTDLGPNGPPPEPVRPDFNPPQGRPSPVIDPEPAPLPPDEPDEGEARALAPIPQVTVQRQGQTSAAPQRAGAAEVVFIVRMKGAPEIDVITRNFRRDPAAAQAAWTDLVTRVPALAEFELTGASFSGEIRLTRRLPDASPAAIRTVQDRLLAIEGVAYADPDYVAHPGEKETP